MNRKLYAADWLLPVESPALREGAVLIENDRISDVGTLQRLRNTYDVPIEFFENSIIAPAWVNAHCHLELSYYHDRINSHNNFVDWVNQLVRLRETDNVVTSLMEAAFEAARVMRRQGTALVGDISNGLMLADLEGKDYPERTVFLELLGFQEKRADAIFRSGLEQITASAAHTFLTPHAPYSTSAALIRKIKAHNKRISIHLAESSEEADFTKEGDSPFHEFLVSRGVWDEDFRSPGLSPVAYLDALQVLDAETLVVHGVQVSAEDIEILARRGSSVALCLRSNVQTNVGLPPLDTYLTAGVPLCIGTDSLASNIDLDMNHEIGYIYDRFKNIDPVLLIEMATLNGARALGREREYGSLQPGRKAALNIFEFTEPVHSHPERHIVAKLWSRLTCL